MVKGRVNVWDVLAWVVLVGIFIWLVLKVIGVINTNIFLEYSPIFGAIYLVGWQIHKLNNIGKEVDGLKKFRNDTIRQIHQIKLNCVKNHGR
jgi:hypothetical protein